MATFGGVTCDIIHGGRTRPRERVDIFALSGFAGYGVSYLGAGDGRPGQLELVYYNTNAAVELWSYSIAALQGQIATVADAIGNTYNVLVAEVGQLEQTAARKPGTLYRRRGSIRVNVLAM